MELSSELVSQFARITNDEPTVNEGSTVYATYRLQGESAYVQIDGSDTITPVATTAGAKSGDRVTVLIKNHRAIVTGNLTDPSANTSTVENLSGTVGGLGTLIDGAARVATDYIEFKTGTGLIVGNQASKDSSGNIVGSNVLIHSQGIDIRDGSTILAQYTDDYIYLGYSNRQATVDLCNGLGTITSSTDSQGLYTHLVIGSIGSMRLEAPTSFTITTDYQYITMNSAGIDLLTSNGTNAVGFEINHNTEKIEVLGTLVGYSQNDHTHGQYYESGDSIHSNYLYIASLGSNSSATPLYISPTSGIVCDEPSSSRRYKNSIQDVTEEILKPEKLYDLPVRQYKWNEGHFMEDEGYDYNMNHIGFIAEEVADIYPYASVIRNNVIETWDARKLVPPMLALIQQQKKKIDELESRINELEGKGVA